MYNPMQPPGKGYLRSLGERAAAVLRKGHQVRYKVVGIKKTNTVTRYQRPWKLKRLLRSVNLYFAGIVLAACIGWLSFVMLAKSDIFKVSSVNVHGNSMVTEHQVLEKAGFKRGGNLLDFDIMQAENKIRSLPWVDEVKIRRHWPSTVEIAVREHKPLALINITDVGKTQLYYINLNGHVFAPIQGATDLDFPVLTGHGFSEDLHEMQIKAESLTGKALHFLKLAAQGNQILPLQAVSEVQVSRNEGLIVYLVDYPFPIYLGQEKIDERFYLLVRVLAQLYNKDKVREVKEIRMDYAEDKIMVAGTGNS
ncbi:MAG: FtsQ-type POTRA domain-containing protein [Desulfobulbaceae bacterium]|nr:FtsQ-type POTRA domain-containing protein [Desulfobulbaceae bacterium]